MFNKTLLDIVLKTLSELHLLKCPKIKLYLLPFWNPLGLGHLHHTLTLCHHQRWRWLMEKQTTNKYFDTNWIPVAPHWCWGPVLYRPNRSWYCNTQLKCQQQTWYITSPTLFGKLKSMQTELQISLCWNNKAINQTDHQQLHIFYN